MAHLSKLADGQFLTALAWGVASLQDADNPRARAKEKGFLPRPTQDKTWLCLALFGALELLSTADLNGLFYLPIFMIRPL
jgi:hypothetical protein